MLLQSSGRRPDLCNKARPTFDWRAANLNLPRSSFGESQSSMKFTPPLHRLQTPSYRIMGLSSCSNTFSARFCQSFWSEPLAATCCSLPPPDASAQDNSMSLRAARPPSEQQQRGTSHAPFCWPTRVRPEPQRRGGYSYRLGHARCLHVEILSPQPGRQQRGQLCSRSVSRQAPASGARGSFGEGVGRGHDLREGEAQARPATWPVRTQDGHSRRERDPQAAGCRQEGQVQLAPQPASHSIPLKKGSTRKGFLSTNFGFDDFPS